MDNVWGGIRVGSTKRYFFITGLPRSRSSWVANYLSYGDTMCFHDGFLGCDNLEAFCAKLRNCHAPAVGNADPMNAVYEEALHSAFPDAKWVVLRRSLPEAQAASEKAFGWQDPKRSIEGVREKVGDVILRRNPMVVDVKDLNYEVAMAVGTYVNPRWDCPKERVDMLLTFNVQLEQDRLDALVAAPPAYPMAEMEPPVVTETNQRYMDRVRLICGSNADAYDWFMQVMVVAHVWDHCVDGDVVNAAQADQAFQALVLDWPTSLFLRRNVGTLWLALRESVDRWKRGEDYAVFEIIPRAIAKVLNVDWSKHECAIVKLVKELKAEDNIKDSWVR